MIRFKGMIFVVFKKLKLSIMKKIILFSIIFISAICVFNSCKTTSIYVDVLKPADITIPGKHEKIAVVNRSLPGKGEKGGNFVEGLFTGEGIHQDRNASDNCINSFSIAVNEAPKYKSTVNTNYDLRGTGTKQWPLPLDWDTVQKLANQYDADLIIVLETFDSDTRYFSNTKNVTTTVDGQKVTKTKYIEGLEVFIDAGWRVYDPANKKVLDQQGFRDAKIWEYDDYDIETARRKIPSKRDAVEQAGGYAGYMYAKRISPTWATEPRTIFKTRNPEMKLAVKYARQKNWNEAYNIWNNLKNDSDVKVSAYALHNLAVYYEVNNDIELALQFANDAYKKYNNNYTAALINTLTYRQAEINRLDEQLR